MHSAGLAGALSLDRLQARRGCTQLDGIQPEESALSGTGFSREGGSGGNAVFEDFPAATKFPLHAGAEVECNVAATV